MSVIKVVPAADKPDQESMGGATEMLPRLPPGWKEYTDNDGRPFYFSEEEGRKTFQRPSTVRRSILNEALEDFPQKGNTSEKKAFVRSMMNQVGIPYWYFCLAGMCFVFITFVLVALACGSMVYYTQNTSFSSGSNQLRRSSGAAVSTASSINVLTADKLRSIAISPEAAGNAAILRGLTEVAFSISTPGGATRVIVLHVQHAEAGANQANGTANELVLSNSVGSYLQIPGDAGVAPSYCDNKGNCQAIKVIRRLGGRELAPEQLSAYSENQVAEDLEKEENEAEEASGGRWTPGVALSSTCWILCCCVGFCCCKGAETGCMKLAECQSSSDEKKGSVSDEKGNVNCCDTCCRVMACQKQR